MQLANYVATLAGGGTRYNAHLLKEVRTYDSAELVDGYDEPPAEIIDIEPENLQAVLQGMRDLVVSGSVAYYFKDCVVDAAAKTGTAQTGGKVSNGVFVAFAPYDDPQIALAVARWPRPRCRSSTPTSPRWTRRRRSWAKICSSNKRRKRSPVREAASLRALYFFCLRISSPKKGRMR